MDTTTQTVDHAMRGREILDFALGRDRDGWAQWQRPTYAIGEPETCWTQFTLTSVADFEAELGFLVRVLELGVFMLQQPDADRPEAFRMAMLADDATSPSFIIGIREADADHPAAAAGTVAHEFMTRDLPGAFTRIVDAGGEIVREPWDEGWIDRATARTPSGHEVRLWSLGDRS